MSQKNIVKRALTHYISISSRVLVVTAGTVTILSVPAYYLDKELGTWPWFFIAALVLALPLSQWLVFKVMKAYFTRNPYQG